MRGIWIVISALQLIFGVMSSDLINVPVPGPVLSAGQEDEPQPESGFEEDYLTFTYALDTGYSWKATSAGSGMFSADNSLYKSEDRGKSWHKLSNSISGSLPSGPVGDLKFQSKDIGWITIHTPRQGEIGLYKTTDGGIQWSKAKLEVSSKYSSALFNPATPVFFSSTDYEIIILNDVEWQNDQGQTESSFMFYASQDNGQHWTSLMDQTKGSWSGLTWEASKSKDSANYQWKISIGSRTWSSSDGVIWRED